MVKIAWGGYIMIRKIVDVVRSIERGTIISLVFMTLPKKKLLQVLWNPTDSKMFKEENNTAKIRVIHVLFKLLRSEILFFTLFLIAFEENKIIREQSVS